MGFPSVQQSSATMAASYLPLTNDVLGPAVGSIVGFCSFAALTIGMLPDSTLISPGCTASTAMGTAHHCGVRCSSPESSQLHGPRKAWRALAGLIYWLVQRRRHRARTDGAKDALMSQELSPRTSRTSEATQGALSRGCPPGLGSK